MTEQEIAACEAAMQRANVDGMEISPQSVYLIASACCHALVAMGIGTDAATFKGLCFAIGKVAERV